MPVAKEYWERIPLDLDGDNEPPTMPVLPGEVSDPIQDRIDALCAHFAGVCCGREPTGKLLARIAKVISEDVGRPVVCFCVSANCDLVGYVVPEVPSKIEVRMELRAEDFREALYRVGGIHEELG